MLHWLWAASPAGHTPNPSCPATPRPERSSTTLDCVKCHGSWVYTRKDRRVKSVPGLSGQVDMCAKDLSRNYSDAQRTNLVKYLNDAFYKFE